jgi:hypothetical protein
MEVLLMSPMIEQTGPAGRGSSERVGTEPTTVETEPATDRPRTGPARGVAGGVLESVRGDALGFRTPSAGAAVSGEAGPVIDYLLDTNICIHALKNRPPEVLERLREVGRAAVAVSVITVHELRHGAEKSRESERVPDLRLENWAS